MVDFVIHGPNGKFVGVTEQNQLKVFSIQQTQLESISEKTGQSYIWKSKVTTSGTDEEVLTVRNDSSVDVLHLDQLWVGGEIAAQFTFGYMTSGTPTGTTVTGRPVNIAKNETADATAFGDAQVTGTVVQTEYATILTAADQSTLIDLEGAWILGKNDVFVVSSELADTVYVQLIGHFDLKE